MTVSRLVCRAEKGCVHLATYLLPLKKPAGDVGWIPACWEHSKDWFKKRPMIGEVLEVDIVSDNAETMVYLGIPAEQVPTCESADAPNAEASSAS